MSLFVPSAPDVTVLPITASGFCVVIDTVAIVLTFDGETYGLAYAWDQDDYADGFRSETIGDAIVEWVENAPEDHPVPWDGCYGCLGTGTLWGFGTRAGVACSCVSHWDR